jgi:hypothetical protein
MRNAWTHRLAAGAIVALTGLALGAAGAAADDTPLSQLVVRSVDGKGNNLQHSAWGQAGVPYRRVAPANYADGKAKQVTPAKPDRYVSNRVFNDIGQNLFSEHGLSQWGWLWGQFIDHDLGLRVETPGESSPLPFNQADPLELFTNDLGSLGFSRTPAAPGTGATNIRQELNTITSYLDASMVYGSDATRATWLRDGASLFLPNGFLPRADARANAPMMDLFGAQVATPGRAVVAGEGQREHRPHGRPDDLRPRAQPHRAPAADVAPGRAALPDRTAGCGGGDRVHHLPRLPAGDGRPARPVHGLQAWGRRHGGQRVRDGRLQGALDGAR